MTHFSNDEKELWDIYDKDRNRTGKLHRRGDELAPGAFHLVVHICIFNAQNQLLMQQRQPWKAGWPNMWDLSAAGSALAGETSKEAAEREVREELGITVHIDAERPLFTFNFKNGFDDFWMIEQDLPLSELRLQYEEVKNVQWADKETLSQMQQDRIVIPYHFLDKVFELKNGLFTSF